MWGSTDTYLVGRFEGRRFVPETESIPGPIHQLYSAYSDFARSPGGYAAQTFTGLPEGRVVQLSWIRTRLEAWTLFQLHQRAEPAGIGDNRAWPPADGAACEGGGSLVGKTVFLLWTGAWKRLSGFRRPIWARPWI